MYQPFDRRPAWHRDAKWLSGLLLALVVALGLLAFSLSSLTRPEPARALIGETLRLALLPGGDVAELEAPADAGAGGRLQLLPGVEVYAEQAELSSLDAEDAAERIAVALGDAVVERGSAGAFELVAAGPLRDQLEAAFATTVPSLVRAELAAALLPTGVGDGTRLADWPSQARANPGEEVQPIVGVFVTVPPAELRGLDPRGIGERVIERLANLALADGLEAARAVVSNVGLRDILVDAIDRDVRAELRAFFSTLLVAQHEQLAARLEQARAAQAARAAAAEAEQRFVQLAGQDLSELPRGEAQQAVLGTLSNLAYREGPEAVSARVTDPAQLERLDAVRGVLRGLDAQAHQRYRRYAWILGAAALVLAALLLTFSAGVGRLLNLGVALAFGALLGTGAYWLLERGRAAALAAPEPGAEAGAVGRVLGAVAELGSGVPASAITLFGRYHLAVLLAGAALVALYLLAQLWRAVRPRRRSYL